MSKEIKDTPVLYGQDAINFLKVIKENENIGVSPEEYRRAMKIFKSVKTENDIENSIKNIKELLNNILNLYKDINHNLENIIIHYDRRINNHANKTS